MSFREQGLLKKIQLVYTVGKVAVGLFIRVPCFFRVSIITPVRYVHLCVCCRLSTILEIGCAFKNALGKLQ